MQKPDTIRRSSDPKALAEAVRAGDRSALGRAITLIESKRPDHAETAQNLLQRLLPDTGKAHRIGLTGVPGAGKSTTIDALGEMLIERGHTVAVLAVDPTSQRSGGSILGDKTRMARLSTNSKAFIRPSPAGDTLGGVARRTRETMLICEAAGHDVIIVETVGIGQSETVVADMVDLFACLMVAGTGDELQGIKKGVLEIADVIAVNKADGDNLARARHAAAELRSALNIITPSSAHWRPPVLCISGLTGSGLNELWQTVEDHRRQSMDTGEFERRRQGQQVRWMWSMVREGLLDRFTATPAVADRLQDIEQAVRDGKQTASQAALMLLDLGLEGKAKLSE